MFMARTPYATLIMNDAFNLGQLNISPSISIYCADTHTSSVRSKDFL
jgi:hypothetical protein